MLETHIQIAAFLFFWKWIFFLDKLEVGFLYSSIMWFFGYSHLQVHLHELLGGVTLVSYTQVF